MDRVVVVGASAGGVSALEALVARLPPGFPAAVLVVLHLPAGYKSLLPGILARAGPLPARDAADGDALLPGQIYVAVPDAHLVIDGPTVLVKKGPQENGFRPSVDVLFRSAASTWGARAIGVVLSGALDDGASGLWAIRRMGGIGIVQEPSDAAYDSMPVHALRRANADHTVRAADIGLLLARLVAEPAPVESAHAAQLRGELDRKSDSPWAAAIMSREPSPYTCPTCHGVMFTIREGTRRRFRCHTGHGFTVGSLLPMLAESSEDALWNAVRTIQEAITLCREAADELASIGESDAAEALLARAARADDKLGLLRSVSRGKGGFEPPS